ncbi:MAG: hypothetical protein Q8L48_02170 [Archangium sp.]|nr:hypothetical protein [Archangium sp.]
MQLIGRVREQEVLRQAMGSSEAELVAVYGRRRVGKTFLIREALGGDVTFELTGVHGAPLTEQLANFAAALASHTRRPAAPAPRDWLSAFAQLSESLKPRRGRKQVLFFDELPWLASRRSGFLRAFEHFWNSWASRRRDLVVVVSGSAAAWMVRELLNARGGLHNRVTRSIRLEAFTISEAEAYFTARQMQLSRYAILELYAALGGVPHYLRQVERGDSTNVAIDRLCFASDGPLRGEFGNLYASLFEHSERHVKLVRALGAKPRGVSRTELIAAAKLTTGGRTTRTLEELEHSGFVLRMPQYGLPANDAVYRLFDEFSLFHLKWIEPHRGRGANVWINKHGSSAWRAWSGYAFEGICTRHVGSLKRALGIEAVETEESAWSHRPDGQDDRGTQIDLVIDGRHGAINLCEMKFSSGEFVIDKRYADELRHKRETFRRVTRTKKSLLLTMVTTNGLRQNQYARELVDKHLTMDALFAR